MASKLFSSAVNALESVVSVIPDATKGSVEIAKRVVNYSVENISDLGSILENNISRWKLDSDTNYWDNVLQTIFESRVRIFEDFAKEFNKIPEDEREGIIKGIKELGIDTKKNIFVNKGYIFISLQKLVNNIKRNKITNKQD